MKNWSKQFDKMSETNEFFGLPYDEGIEKLIKSFIKQVLETQKKEIISGMPKEKELANFNFKKKDGKVVKESIFIYEMILGYNICLQDITNYIKSL